MKQVIEEYEAGYSNGYIAFQNGEWLDDNPYDSDTDSSRHQGFVHGWKDAQDEKID